jgi:hypothetical protein
VPGLGFGQPTGPPEVLQSDSERTGMSDTELLGLLLGLVVVMMAVTTVALVL